MEVREDNFLFHEYWPGEEKRWHQYSRRQAGIHTGSILGNTGQTDIVTSGNIKHLP